MTPGRRHSTPSRRGTTAPTAVEVVTDVRLDTANGGASFAVSKEGTLAYVSGGADNFAETFIVDRLGSRPTPLDETASTGQPTFSPDGRRVALALIRGGQWGIGVYDLERGLTPIALKGDHVLRRDA